MCDFSETTKTCSRLPNSAFFWKIMFTYLKNIPNLINKKIMFF